LNRDLSKVIIMDSNPDAYSLQPENSIAMKPWLGDPNDTELVAMIPFLESMCLVLDSITNTDFIQFSDTQNCFFNGSFIFFIGK